MNPIRWAMVWAVVFSLVLLLAVRSIERQVSQYTHDSRLESFGYPRK